MAGRPASAAGGGNEATSPARTASVAKYCVRRVRRATSTKGLGLCGTPPGYRRPTAVDADRGHHTPRPRSRVAGRRSHAAASRGRHPRVCCASFSRAAGLIPPGARFGSARWDVWGSWDESGRGRVQICHKGAPRRDRPRRKARNTNDSSRALRLDPGLCGRFGQPAPLQARGEGVSGRFLNVIWIETAAAREEGSRGPAGDHGGRPGDRTGPVTAPSVPLGHRPDTRDRRVTRENVC